MEAIFLRILNMSITAGWLVLAVLLLRLVLKNAPKALRCALWALVGVRLALPFSLESMWSLLPSAEPIPMEALQTGTITVDTGIAALDQAVNPAIAEVFTPAVIDTAQTAAPVSAPTVVSVTQAAAVIWLAGMVLMLLYTVVSYLRLRRRVAASIPAENGLWLCDGVETPFILGILRPRIYIPSAMPEEQVTHVAAHEQAHLQRRDHWWKPLGFLLLSIHWFNPLLWLAYILLCQDIELACDEKVIRDMGVDEKKAYSLALLETSVPRRMIAACPLAFGEVGVKARIRSVLHYKKPAFWLALVSAALCLTAAVCLLTDPYESTRLMGAEYKVTEILYVTPGYTTNPAAYPKFCLTADRRLYIRGELMDARWSDLLTPEDFLEEMLSANRWTGRRGLPAISDAWLFQTEDNHFYMFMQTKKGETLLAYGWEDMGERHEGPSDDSTVRYLCRLENQFGENHFDVDFFARSLRETVGSSVEPFAYWSHAHKPGYAVVGFHAGEGSSQSDMPDMGYAVFETENGGYLLKDWQLCPGAAQTPSRIVTAGTAVLGDAPTDANTYDVILSSNPYLHTVKRVYYKGDTLLGEEKYLADSPYSMLMLPWDAYPEADRVSQYFYDEQGREIDPDAETVPSAGQIAPLLGNAVSPDGRFEIRLEGVNTGITSGGLYPPATITIYDRENDTSLWKDIGYFSHAALWSPDSTRLALIRTGRVYCYVSIVDTSTWTAWDVELLLPSGTPLPEYVFPEEDFGVDRTGMQWLSEREVQLCLYDSTTGFHYQCVVDATAPGTFTMQLAEDISAIRIPADVDTGMPPEKKYALPTEVVDHLSWEYEAEIQKLADYPEAALEVYDLREPWEDTLFLRWGGASRCFDGKHITPSGMSFFPQLLDADRDGQQELAVIGLFGSGTGVSVQHLDLFKKQDSGIIRYTPSNITALRSAVENMIAPASRTMQAGDTVLQLPDGLDLINFALGNLVDFSAAETGITGSWIIQFVKEGTAFRGVDDFAVRLSADIFFSEGAFTLTNFRLSRAW